MDECSHVPTDVTSLPQPQATGCQECLRIGSHWVHLRVCQGCGIVACCDESPKRHARAHYRATPDHPLVRSFEPGEAWWYCWEDDFGFELDGIEPLTSP